MIVIDNDTDNNFIWQYNCEQLESQALAARHRITTWHW
jgi:hypothetical protein